MASNQPFDPSGPFQQQQRSRSIWGPLLMLLIALGVLLMDGTSGVSDAVNDPLDGASLPQVGAALVAIVAALALVGALLRPAGPGAGGGANPLSTATMTTRTSMPDRHGAPSRFPTMPPARPLTPTARPVGGNRPGGKLRGAFVAIAILVAIGSAIADVGRDSGADAPSVDAPDFTFRSPDDADPSGDCAPTAAGADVLDSSMTDCAPLELDDVFSPDRTMTVQGTRYLLVDRDETGSCSALGANPVARTALATCSRAIRALYVSPDGSVLGSSILLVFPVEALAAQANAEIASGSELRVLPPETPDGAPVAGLPPRLDELQAVQACFATGRYVTCATSASTAAAPTAQQRSAAIAAIRDFAFIATDALVARRIRSL